MGSPAERARAAPSVLIVDTEPVFAEGVRAQLTAARTLRCLGRVSRVREVLPTCARACPDLVLLDASMDPAAFLLGTLKHAQRAPLVAALVTESAAADGYVDLALAAGADLLAPRALPAADLFGGFERLRRRSPVVHPSLAGYRSPGSAEGDTPCPITVRQFEVLCLMADGKGNEVIAAELYVAAETVRTHVKGIRHALAATSRAHAVSRAFQLGLLPVDRVGDGDRRPRPVAAPADPAAESLPD